MGEQPDKLARAQRLAVRLEALAGLDSLRQVLCEPSRLALLGALETEPLSVGELAHTIGRKLPATSQHLRVLRRLGLVEGERRGTAVYYRLTPGPLADQVRTLITVLEGVVSSTPTSGDVSSLEPRRSGRGASDDSEEGGDCIEQGI
jgi:arsenate reductase